MEKQKKPWYKRWWAITLFSIFVFGIIGELLTNNEKPTEKAQEVATQKPTETLKQEVKSQEPLKSSEPAKPKIVSTSFEDFYIICDSQATSLQKEEEFKKFKNQYVEWEGEVMSISESLGNYNLHVKHCPNTFVSDVSIVMKDDQKDKLLKYRESDTIKYRAKLFRIGDILGVFGNEGEVIE